MPKTTLRALAAGSPLLAALALAAAADARPACGLTGDEPCPSPERRSDGTALGTVNVNDGYRLVVRKRPTSSSRAVRRIADGRRVRIVCQTTGQRVSGRYGTTRIWDRLAGGGYVSDAFIYTGSDGRVAKDCRTRRTPPSPNTAAGRPRSITLRDDYPFRTGSWHEADPWAFYQRECTSFVAFRLNRVMRFHNLMRGGRFSNAENWDENARAIGFKVDRRPKVGSVMVRNSGTYGHVALVAKVRGSRIFVEQYNAGGTHRYSKQWLSRSSVMTFIHFRT